MESQVGVYLAVGRDRSGGISWGRNRMGGIVQEVSAKV